MADEITRYKHKRSDVAGKIPVADDFLDGEIIVNTADGLAFLNTPSGVKTFLSADRVARVDAEQILTPAEKGRAIANISGGILAGLRNRLLNGDFLINQREFSSSTIPGYTVDMWGYSTAGTGTVATISRQVFQMGDVSVPGNPSCYMNVNVANGGDAVNGFIGFYNLIEDVRTFAGKKITVTVHARCSTAGRKLSVGFSQLFGNSGDPRVNIHAKNFDLSNVFQKHSVVVDIPSVLGKTRGGGNDSLALEIMFSVGSSYNARSGNLGVQTGSFDIAHVSVVEGDATAEDDPFSPRHLSEELRLCQRYYERVQGIANNDGPYFQNFFYKVDKRAIPTVTLISGNISPATVETRNWRYFTLNNRAGTATGFMVAADASL